jgi:hypothetical protein
MSEKSLILTQVKQFYDDIETLVKQDPNLILEGPTIDCYNAMLEQIKAALASHQGLQAFQNWEPRNIKAKDALVCVGQLASLVSHELGD